MLFQPQVFYDLIGCTSRHLFTRVAWDSCGSSGFWVDPKVMFPAVLHNPAAVFFRQPD